MNRRSYRPIETGNRIEEVDMVRGFALLGVMLVNMFNFGAYSQAWTAPTDEWTFSVMRFFFETKSWRLFSLLFGFGFSLQLLRAEQSGARFLPVYLRRLAILFVIGMCHALFYRGDILMLYAELGLALTLFRRASPRLLLILAVVLLALFPVGRAVTTLAEGADSGAPTRAAAIEEALEEIEKKRKSHPHAVGSIRKVWVANSAAIPKNPFKDPLGPESGFAVFAMFLIGLYVGRRGIVRDIPRHWTLIRGVSVWGMGLGLLAMAAERILHVTTGYNLFRTQQATALPQFIGDLVFTYGATALSLGYAATIVVLARRVTWRKILSPLAPVGRMALTNYLAATLMFTTLFYGYAFGRAFLLGPTVVFAYAIGFFGIQVAVSVWWMKCFRFGPMEWLWRTLTYMQLQPIRHRKAP
jgi:uncharacterized protein